MIWLTRRECSFKIKTRRDAGGGEIASEFPSIIWFCHLTTQSLVTTGTSCIRSTWPEGPQNAATVFPLDSSAPIAFVTLSVTSSYSSHSYALLLHSALLGEKKKNCIHSNLEVASSSCASSVNGGQHFLDEAADCLPAKDRPEIFAMGRACFVFASSNSGGEIFRCLSQ